MSLRDGFKLGDWTVQPLEGCLVRDGAETRIQPRSMDVLVCLAENAGAVVERDTILRRMWGERAQSDEPLTRCIGELRRALGDTKSSPRYIQTIPKRGYKLLAEVTSHEPPAAASGKKPELGKFDRPWTGLRPGVSITVVVLVAVGLILVYRFVFQQDLLPPGPLRASADGMSGPVAEKSLAVLPFRAISSGADDDYFADGLTEEIINSLGQLPELQVTARTSAFFFKGKVEPIPEIARTLGVAHIVEGSVRRDDRRLRISARLSRASDGINLWSEVYDRTADDAIAVQIDIAENVASALDIVLDETRRAQMRAAGVGDPQAFIAYQKGLELYTLAHPNEDQFALLAQANKFFEEAIARVPEFSEAHHRHSDYYMHVLLDAVAGRQNDGVSQSDVDAARTALQADLDAAVRFARDEGRRLNVQLDRKLLTGEWQGLSASIDRLLEKTACTGSLWLQTIALPYDKTAAVRTFFRNQIDCDPLQFLGWVWDANALIWLGDFDTAYDVARSGLSLIPQERLRSTMVKSLIAAGEYDEAQTMINRDLTTQVTQLGNTIMLAAARGDLSDATALVADFRENFETGSDNALHFYAWIGDREMANKLAADADGHPFGHMILVIAINNCYCGAPFDLEVTPNFAHLLEQASFPWPPNSPIEWPLKSW